MDSWQNFPRFLLGSPRQFLTTLSVFIVLFALASESLRVWLINSVIAPILIIAALGAILWSMIKQGMPKKSKS